jgi:hypothetical protein
MNAGEAWPNAGLCYLLPPAPPDFGNGNILSSANSVSNLQNKSFNYNLLNLPIVTTVPTGTAIYTYDATGNGKMVARETV